VQKVLPDAVYQRVYDAYTIEQLAEILGLPKIKTAKPVAMSKEDNVEDVFSKYGAIRGGEIISEVPLDSGKDFDFKKFETSLLMTFKKELSVNEKAIVDLLSKDSLMPTDAIAKVLKIDKSQVNDIISSLDKGGYLEVGDLETTPTLKGEVAIEEGAKTDNVKVEYRYSW
jgi:hypothetical protein